MPKIESCGRKNDRCDHKIAPCVHEKDIRDHNIAPCVREKDIHDHKIAHCVREKDIRDYNTMPSAHKIAPCVREKDIRDHKIAPCGRAIEACGRKAVAWHFCSAPSCAHVAIGDDLRAKIACGKAHFEALKVSKSPAKYILAKSVDEVVIYEQ